MKNISDILVFIIIHVLHLKKIGSVDRLEEEEGEGDKNEDFITMPLSCESKMIWDLKQGFNLKIFFDTIEMV